MNTVSRTGRPAKGRPLSFDREVALHQAMLLFWRHGYEATSLNDLTSAMGITPPSIYTAFGDKKRLFLEAVNRYVSGPVTSESIIESAETAEQAVRTLLETAATGFTGKNTPRGCLLASSAISCSSAAADVQRELARIRRKIEMRLKDKIARGVKGGELNADADAAGLAAFAMAVVQGMSTLARDGATRQRLMKVSETAMQSFCAAKKK